MSILSIFDKFDHNNKIHNHIDNILHNFSSFFFNMIYYFILFYFILLLIWFITVTVIIMKIVKLIYIYIIIRYWLYKYFLEFLKLKKRKSYELNKNISWSLLIKL